MFYLFLTVVACSWPVILLSVAAWPVTTYGVTLVAGNITALPVKCVNCILVHAISTY